MKGTTGTSRLSSYVPAAAVAVVASAAGWVTTRSLQQDFAAYWVAGAARRMGLDPYVNHVGEASGVDLWDGVAVFAHSRFLYPPLIAELFRPLAALPYAVAKTLFAAIGVACWVAASVLAARAATGDRDPGAQVAWTLGAGALFYPLYAHLERGQLDLVVLVLLLAAWSGRARPVLAGGALALAVTFKPAVAGVLLPLAALGRWRWMTATLAGVALLALAGVASSGTGPLREYVTNVLPRVAVFGEGGDENMLLPPARLAHVQGDLEAGVATIDGRTYRLSAWDRPASASLSRLLAPETPSRAVTRFSAFVILSALILAAILARRRDLPADAEATLFFAAVVACVVASPTGWVMGLVWVLPLVPFWRALAVSGRAHPAALRWSARALLACAVPPVFAGWAALAGTAVVATAIALVLTLHPRLEPAP
jgi:Glycosyltransferase family 87